MAADQWDSSCEDNVTFTNTVHILSSNIGRINTHTHSHTTHLWPMLFPLPPRAAANFSSTAPGKCRLWRERQFNTDHAHTSLLGSGRRLSQPWSWYSGVIVWTVIWGQEAVSWFVVLSKIHYASAPLISSCHNLWKLSLYKSNTWWFIGWYLSSVMFKDIHTQDMMFILLEYYTHKFSFSHSCVIDRCEKPWNMFFISLYTGPMSGGATANGNTRQVRRQRGFNIHTLLEKKRLTGFLYRTLLLLNPIVNVLKG